MQRKAEQKKVSACCPESGISDTLKESPAAGECRACCRFGNFGGPKKGPGFQIGTAARQIGRAGC